MQIKKKNNNSQNNEVILSKTYQSETYSVKQTFYYWKGKRFYERLKGWILVVLLHKKGKLWPRSKLLNSQNNVIILCVAYKYRHVYVLLIFSLKMKAVLWAIKKLTARVVNSFDKTKYDFFFCSPFCFPLLVWPIWFDFISYFSNENIKCWKLKSLYFIFFYNIYIQHFIYFFSTPFMSVIRGWY